MAKVSKEFKEKIRNKDKQDLEDVLIKFASNEEIF